MLIRFPNGYLELGWQYWSFSWGVSLTWDYNPEAVRPGESRYRKTMGIVISREFIEDGGLRCLWYPANWHMPDPLAIDSAKWTGRSKYFVGWQNALRNIHAWKWSFT